MNETKGVKHPEWTKHSNIYEVNIRQYTTEGNFAAFEQHLERLKDMGVDILWLMPVNPIGNKNRKGSLGSYYAVKDYTAVNPEFGTMEDFKKLVNSIHSLGMHVIIDWVANHTAWDHPWTQQHPQWYQKDENGNIKSPFDWSDVVALDYENHELWEAMAGEMEFWIKETDIDGFRCDVAMLVKTEFWEYARRRFEKNKPVFMLAEAEEPDHHKAAFDMSYAWEMHKKFEAIINKKEPATAIHTQVSNDLIKFGTDSFRMQFTTNHDENSWNGTEYEKFGDAVKIMAVLSFIIPGMPLIYSGQEAANKKRLEFFDKDVLNWDNISLHDFYKNLIELKNNNKALWNGNSGGDYHGLTTTCNEKTLAIVRQKDDNKVLFVGNFSSDNLEIEIEFGDFAGEYRDLFTGNIIKFERKNPFILKPWQYNIFIY